MAEIDARGGGGAPGESNEEAMLRLMGRGKGDGRGKGRGKGKGHGRRDQGPPPSCDEIPADRRASLREELEAFAAGVEAQLTMPPDVTGLERRYLHELAEALGLTTQSFGKGRDRRLCIFRGTAAGAAEGDAGDAGEDDPPPMADGATYSAVALDDDSRQRLRDFCGHESLGGIPEGWTLHCEHMTVCTGPLSMPRTEDNRSIADAVHRQIATFRHGQDFDLRVVSTGRAAGVLAVGVVGCASCNKNPHVTVATAPGVKPVQSNLIQRWHLLPAEEQIVMRGTVEQRGA